MKEQILEMLTELRPEMDFTQEADFIEEGMLDSLDIVSIVDSIEEIYGVNIPGTEILPENFNSVDAIINLISKYKA